MYKKKNVHVRYLSEYEISHKSVSPPLLQYAMTTCVVSQVSRTTYRKWEKYPRDIVLVVICNFLIQYNEFSVLAIQV